MSFNIHLYIRCEMPLLYSVNDEVKGLLTNLSQDVHERVHMHMHVCACLLSLFFSFLFFLCMCMCVCVCACVWL